MSQKPRVTATEIRFFIEGSAKTRLETFRRIARIIDFEGKLLPKSHGYPYMIGTSNDWWLGHEPACGRTMEVIVAKRYGDLEFMSKLRDVLIKLLYVENINNEKGKASYE